LYLSCMTIILIEPCNINFNIEVTQCYKHSLSLHCQKCSFPYHVVPGQRSALFLRLSIIFFNFHKPSIAACATKIGSISVMTTCTCTTWVCSSELYPHHHIRLTTATFQPSLCRSLLYCIINKTFFATIFIYQI